MIRVVGANPAMDRVALWPGLVVGGVNRAAEVTVMAGGKSLNQIRNLIRINLGPGANRRRKTCLVPPSGPGGAISAGAKPTCA